MAIPGQTTLGEIRTIARQRADMVNSKFVTDVEFNNYINLSYYELYDLIVQCYGDNYYVQTPFTFTTTGANVDQYPLPDDFYKLLGVDVSISNTINSFYTLMPFNFGDRNRFSFPNFQTIIGPVNLYYRLNGNNIWFTPVPQGGQTIRLWYIPRLTPLQFSLPAATVISTTTVTIDTTDLVVGMTIDGVAIPQNTTITAVGVGSITISNPANASTTNQLVNAYIDTTIVDGVSGWEEYIIVDAAMKALEKEESDVSIFMAQKQGLIQRIQSAAENRDAGNPATVVDTQRNGWYGNNNGFGGNGNGGSFY